MNVKLFVVTKNKSTFADINIVLAEIKEILICGQFFEENKNNKLTYLLRMVKPDMIVVDDTLDESTIISLATILIKNNLRCGVIGLYKSLDEKEDYESLFEEKFIKILKPIEVDRLKFVINTILDDTRSSYIDRKLPELRIGREFCDKILTFYSPKDGEGLTTIVVNLAYMLNQKFNQKVLLLNLNPIFDDSDVYLNFKSELNIEKLFERFNFLSSSLEQLLYIIEEHPVYKNMYVISGSDFPTQLHASNKNMEFFELFLRFVESKFDWILIDTYSVLDNLTLMMFKISKNPFIVLQNHIISVRNVEIILALLEHCGVPEDKFRFIATRISRFAGLKPSQLKVIFERGEQFFAHIPSRGQLAVECISKKVPLLELCTPEDNFYRVFDAMARTLVGKEPINYKAAVPVSEENIVLQGIKKFFKSALGKK